MKHLTVRGLEKKKKRKKREFRVSLSFIYKKDKFIIDVKEDLLKTGNLWHCYTPLKLQSFLEQLF